MTEFLTKENVSLFTMGELRTMFPSINSASSATKAILVEDILTASLKDNEIAGFVSDLDEKKKTIEDARKAVPKAKAKITFGAEDDVEFDPDDDFIVMFPIKENGRVYKQGDPYEGKKIGRYLNAGQIRKKDN